MEVEVCSSWGRSWKSEIDGMFQQKGPVSLPTRKHLFHIHHYNNHCSSCNYIPSKVHDEAKVYDGNINFRSYAYETETQEWSRDSHLDLMKNVLVTIRLSESTIMVIIFPEKQYMHLDLISSLHYYNTEKGFKFYIFSLYLLSQFLEKSNLLNE